MFKSVFNVVKDGYAAVDSNNSSISHNRKVLIFFKTTETNHSRQRTILMHDIEYDIQVRELKLFG